MGQVAHLDVAGVLNPDDGKTTLFLLNRDLTKPREVEVNWEGKAGGRLLTSWVLTGDDLKAVNGFEAPNKVAPKAADKPSSTGGRINIELPPRSYSVYQWGA